MIRKLLFGLAIALASFSAAEGAPVLRSEVLVNAPVVTVGDMFEDAGSVAELPLFRAPAPGTSGLVSVEDVRRAAVAVGLTEFASGDVLRVRVTRDAVPVTEATLTDLMITDLRARGIVSDDVTTHATFDQTGLTFNAEAVAEPVRLASLRYMPGSGAFLARFLIAGQDAPVDVSGRIELLVPAPHLVATLRAGTVLQETDLKLQPVPLRYAESAGYAALEDVVGKALVRQTRAGTALRSSDVTEPQLIGRNDFVTIYYKRGALTLTAKGQALEGAAEGQPLPVLNLISKKVLQTVAVGPGAVQLHSPDLTVAGL